MKHLLFWVTVGIFSLLAAVVGSVALLHAQNARDYWLSGGSYITTVKDSAGNFSSREVITLHADHTMSEIDSGQGGPTFFSSELGSWKQNGSSSIVARMIDFDLPPSPDIARLDYIINFSQDRTQVTGAITFSTFPLETGNPIDGEGTVVGTFTFAGELIKP